MDLQSKTRIVNVASSFSFEIQMYHQHESRFNGVFSGDNLPDKIKDGAYVINLDEYSDIVMLLILTALELNIFQKKLKYLLINLQL